MNSRIINELNELVRAAELSDDEYAAIRITNLIGDLSRWHLLYLSGSVSRQICAILERAV